MRGERLLRKAEALEFLEILRRKRRSVARNRLPCHRSIGRILDFVEQVHQLAGVDSDDGCFGAELPWQPVDIGVELEAHGSIRVDLRILDFVRRIDVAQSGRLADLLIERHQQVAECEHDGGGQSELQQQRTIRLVRLPVVGRGPHRRPLRVIAANRNPTKARPSIPSPTFGELEYWARMMPPNEASATTARTTAVRTLAARCDARVEFACVMVAFTVEYQIAWSMRPPATFGTCDVAPARAASTPAPWPRPRPLRRLFRHRGCT